ncbi:hypothetical protein K2173_004084 [Erythroxylum novogranatense]|uniref:DUF761 domain-containing protein n=1 Tax=Erythroxylum novogranatense TaxID=1862640 RepID=A0AAV8SKG4_9ROSI|nr:hypothetical protein K2173_004084 [Erythroxylum novogranatense]
MDHQVHYSRVSSMVGKRLWNVVRVTLLMMRKGLMSKRKLIMDLNLMMKRGKLLRKSLSNLISHHLRHENKYSSRSRSMARGGYGIQEYEFSCSNSPNPVFFHVPAGKRKVHHYFPCVNLPQVVEEEEEEEEGYYSSTGPNKAVVIVPKTPEPYVFNFCFDASDLAPGEKRSPLLSPFAVRVSNYSSEDDIEENDNVDTGTCRRQVDDEAEEFIKRFYEQLRVQSRMQLLRDA